MNPFATRKAKHLRLGRRGEKIAARLLRELGYDVLVRNYTHTDGEIDIVARDNGTLCFIEVKTRRREIHGRPADAVGAAKRRRIIHTAKRYLRELGSPALPYRYDIIEVVTRGPFVQVLRYWNNAFAEPAAEHAGKGRASVSQIKMPTPT